MGQNRYDLVKATMKNSPNRNVSIVDVDADLMVDHKLVKA